MLIKKELHTVALAEGNDKSIGIFVISPVLPAYPQARFPGVVVFRWDRERGLEGYRKPIIELSEIYQVTGPVERFAGQIASQGYVVGNASLLGLPFILTICTERSLPFKLP